MCVVENEQQNKLFCKWIILASRQSCRTASTPDDSHEQQQNNILKQQNKGAVNDSRVRGPIPSVPNTATHSHAVLFLHKSDCLPLGSLSPTWTLKRPVMGMINGSRKKKGGTTQLWNEAGMKSCSLRPSAYTTIASSSLKLQERMRIEILHLLCITHKVYIYLHGILGEFRMRRASKQKLLLIRWIFLDDPPLSAHSRERSGKRLTDASNCVLRMR